MEEKRLTKRDKFWAFYEKLELNIVMALCYVLGPELAQLVRWITLNQEVPCSNLATAIWEKSAYAVGQSNLPMSVLDNDHLLSRDYEHGLLKDMITTIKLEYLICTKLSRTKSIKL